MRIVAIITARYASKRLPGKALALIEGKPLLWHVVDRVRASCVDETVVATTESSQPIIDFCTEKEVPFFVGDEENLLDRLFHTALGFGVDLIVRVWGDSPFIDPEIIDKTVRIYNTSDAEYVYNIGYPQGMQAAVVSFKTLQRVWKEVTEPECTHWIHLWMGQHLKCKLLKNPEHLSQIDLSVDTLDDLDMARWIYSKLYRKNKYFNLRDILGVISNLPDRNE